MQFCARTMAQQFEDETFLSRWCWSDECHIQLDGQVSRQNLRFWGWQKPDLYEVCPLQIERITVWCALSAHAIIRPYFIEGILDAKKYQEEVIDRFQADLMTFGDIL